MKDTEDSRIVNRRYILEDRFIDAIRCGNCEKALQYLDEFKDACSGLKFLSDELNNRIAGAAIVRTLVRTGAKLSGLSPVLIDSISQDYALKMQAAASLGELDMLQAEVVERFCQEIQNAQGQGYSAYVQKAIAYMRVHLEEPLTARELSREAGVNQQQLVKHFSLETGMTIKQYLAKIRCDAAARLLVDSKQSIQEIGMCVGYMDNNYFSKVFKSNKGDSPQNYRRKHWSST